MPDFTVPEIQRTSLTAVILTLKCLGVHDVIRYTNIQSVTSIHLCSLYFYTNQLIFFLKVPLSGLPRGALHPGGIETAVSV